ALLPSKAPSKLFFETKRSYWAEGNRNPQSGPVIQVPSSGSLDGILSPEDTSGFLVKKEPISVPPKSATDAVGVGNKTPTDWSGYYNKLQPYRQYSDTVQPSRVDPTRTGQVTNADGSQNIWITRTKVDGTWHSDEQIYIDPQGNAQRTIVEENTMCNITLIQKETAAYRDLKNMTF
ncbi:MAG: hypothetical protein SGI98_02840, partial [Verrucomicrobiota bacterium]|nr:hypothetical protein [Verrucomicrobiota bacterium]